MLEIVCDIIVTLVFDIVEPLLVNIKIEKKIRDTLFYYFKFIKLIYFFIFELKYLFK